MTRKSFVVAVAITVSAAAMTMAAAQGRITGRLLAVFEDATGQPVAGAEVADLATNTRAVTSALAAIFAADTNSITVVLEPLTQTLPVVVGLVLVASQGRVRIRVRCPHRRDRTRQQRNENDERPRFGRIKLQAPAGPSESWTH